MSGPESEGPDLRELLLERATRLEDVETVALSEGLAELRLDGRPFAAVGAASAAYRLRPEVAAASLRTPDVGSAGRDPGWVSFAPPVLDAFARDRAIAWLESA